jgi:arylformamidase
MDRTLSEADYTSHYMPRIAVPDHETWLAEDFARSAAVRDRLPHRRNARYGPGPLQLIDVFPAKAPGSPVLVFIHGGYWRALSKDHYGFIAEPFVAAGAAVALVEYDLCPTVHLSTLVEQVAQAIAWIRAEARGFGGDPDRLALCGNSAGAHLAAMMLCRDWNDADGGRFIRGASLLTGIYDLAPIPHIQVRDDVHLTPGEIAALSPQRRDVRVKAPCLVSVGADEPPLWIEESRRYDRKLREAGVESALMIVPGHHHFSITRCLAEPEHPLFRATVDLLRR